MNVKCKACIESGTTKTCITSNGYECEHYHLRTNFKEQQQIKPVCKLSEIDMAIQFTKKNIETCTMFSKLRESKGFKIPETALEIHKTI